MRVSIAGPTAALWEQSKGIGFRSSSMNPGFIEMTEVDGCLGDNYVSGSVTVCGFGRTKESELSRDKYLILVQSLSR